MSRLNLLRSSGSTFFSGTCRSPHHPFITELQLAYRINTRSTFCLIVLAISVGNCFFENPACAPAFATAKALAVRQDHEAYRACSNAMRP